LIARISPSNASDILTMLNAYSIRMLRNVWMVRSLNVPLPRVGAVSFVVVVVVVVVVCSLLLFSGAY